MFSYRQVWGQENAFYEATKAKDGNADREISYRVMADVPVVLFDHVLGKRRVVPMRWGFPHPKDWKRPQPIHARAETIETTKAFAEAFHSGQRGIVLVKTFNEAPDVEGPTIQHTITPGDGGPIGIAFIWRQFEVPPFACVMVTVPANALIATLPTDRMPAVLANEDWATWLAEKPGTVDEIKACLKTVEGVKWTMTKEERTARTKRGKPTVSDPSGLA